jgi:flagellar hook-basal body complex protein FliE
MAIDTRNLDQMLAELRSASAITSGKPAQPAGAVGADTDFALALKSAIDQVSQVQQSAQQMTQDFASGSSNVNLQDVMVNLQKANLSFQQMSRCETSLSPPTMTS